MGGVEGFSATTEAAETWRVRKKQQSDSIQQIGKQAPGSSRSGGVMEILTGIERGCALVARLSRPVWRVWRG